MWEYRPIKTIRTDTTLDLSQKAEKSAENRYAPNDTFGTPPKNENRRSSSSQNYHILGVFGCKTVLFEAPVNKIRPMLVF
jgi:hypothetical protein